MATFLPPLSARLCTFLGVLLCVSLFSSARGQDIVDTTHALTLRECIEIAKAQSLEIETSNLQVRSAEVRLSSARWGLAPSISAGANHGYTFGRAIDYGSNQVSSDLMSTNFSIGANLNLFDGLRSWKEISRSKLNLQKEEALREDTQFLIEVNVTEAFLKVLYQQELRKTFENQVELSKDQLEKQRIQVKVGKQPEGALLTFESQLAQDEQRLVESQNALDMAKLQLAQIMNVRAGSIKVETPVVDDSEIAQTVAEGIGPIFKDALQSNPRVRAQQLNVNIAEKNVELAQGEHYPTLSVGVSYGSGARHFIHESMLKSQEDPFFTQIRNNASTNISFSLQVPIFSKMSTYNNVQQAKIGRLSAQIDQKRGENDLYKRLQQLYADALGAYRSYLAAKKSHESQELAFTWAKQRLEVGTITVYEYNDAKNKLNSAQVTLIQSKFNYVFKVKLLNLYRGSSLAL